MSDNKTLHIRFLRAFKAANSMDDILIPIDLRLQFYAYYKQAVLGNTFSYAGEVDVRDAFKFNAWTQLNGMTQENAKKQYIKLVENIVNNQNK